jgi:hypothetical protein
MPMSPEPVNLGVVRNVAVCTRLRALLDGALDRLGGLNADPVVVASCPLKFNDVGHDSGWQAVQVGAFASERQEYFEAPSAHDRRLREGPEPARRANQVLAELETQNWRDLYSAAFDRNLSAEEVIALVIQDGRCWFVASGSNSGENAVYALPPEGGLRHIGRVFEAGFTRFDQRIGEARPLLIRRPEEDAAERTAVMARISELMTRPARQHAPLWAPGARHRSPSLSERIDRLADSGRVSEQEYLAMREALVLRHPTQAAASGSEKRELQISVRASSPQEKSDAAKLEGRISELERSPPENPGAWWLKAPRSVPADPMTIVERLDQLAGSGRISEREYHSILERLGGAEGPLVQQLRNWRGQAANWFDDVSGANDRWAVVSRRVEELEQLLPGDAADWWRRRSPRPIAPLTVQECLDYLGLTGRISREEYQALLRRVMECG